MEDGSEIEENIPLLGDAKDHIVRTGTVRTASAHIITAVIGSGVLSLAWSVAQLGWIAGPFAIIFFAAVTLIQSSILSDCYRSPNSEHGHIRNRSYMDAVKLNLGENSMLICGVLQQLSLFGNAIAYTITSASSMRAIQKSICYHRDGGHKKSSSCSIGINYFMVLFGAFQVVLSLIPDIHDMEWLSMLATLMSFCYSTIAFALVFAKVLANGAIKGSIKGVPALSAYDKVIKISLSLGDILYAYPFTSILLEIQDTLKSPPSETQTMKKATAISISISTMFYLACGCFGYAAFGNETQGNLLSGSGFSEPRWLIDFANACVVIHIMGGYQMYSQPIFQYCDKWFASKFPNSKFVNKVYEVKFPLLPCYKTNALRLSFRTLYVILTTWIAIIFPFFNQVLGVLGAFGFWNLSIYYPIEMYFVQRKVRAWSKNWILLQIFSCLCLIVSLYALVGSVQGLISEKLS